MSDRIELGEFRIVDLANDYRRRARENAPATVEFAVGGVVLGSVAFGPAGGVVGATAGSLVGYLRDEGHLDAEGDGDGEGEGGLGTVRIEVGDKC